MVKVYDLRIAKPQYVLKGENLKGFDWSHYCKSLLATFSSNSDVVQFWDLNNSESELSKKELLKSVQSKA